ncbi:aldolase/citrate lyase family protein [Pseudomonas sp. DWP1b1]|uniref:aldolase/citrate lyase family protein n=1 Tax=unclassified Pseudomonas TaxID=196821 RepID=UPI003CF90DDF
MQIPVNHFKHAIAQRRKQIGLWCSLPGSYVAEVVAATGFDWLLLDTEHSPSDVLSVLPQLQALAPYPVNPIVRPASNNAVLIKRFLDIGAQTLLIPYVQNEIEAESAVAAMRYPPEGIRGVSGLTRATRFGRIDGYAQRAREELCLLVQVETAESLERLEKIALIEGVDGVFIGPADLAASLGFPGEPNCAAVVNAIEDAIKRLKRIGKPSGILTLDVNFARRCLTLGATFVAVGVDVGILARSAEKLASELSTVSEGDGEYKPR